MEGLSTGKKWCRVGFGFPSLLIRQQGGAFAVLGHDFAAADTVFAEKLGEPDTNRQNEQERTNGESEDPLELQNRVLGEKLANASSCQARLEFAYHGHERG